MRAAWEHDCSTQATTTDKNLKQSITLKWKIKTSMAVSLSLKLSVWLCCGRSVSSASSSPKGNKSKGSKFVYVNYFEIIHMESSTHRCRNKLTRLWLKMSRWLRGTEKNKNVVEWRSYMSWWWICHLCIKTTFYPNINTAASTKSEAQFIVEWSNDLYESGKSPHRSESIRIAKPVQWTVWVWHISGSFSCVKLWLFQWKLKPTFY